jgi:phospholipase D1/2
MANQRRRESAQKRRLWIAGAVLLLLFAGAAAWKWTPLADLIDVGYLARWANAWRESPARHFYLLAAYVIGSILMVPITLLILVTAIVFGPMLGSVYALIGSLAGAIVTYAIGYLLGKDFVQKIAGPKWSSLEEKISQTGIIAVATARLLPVAPFTVVNIVSGAFKVPPRDYFIGSILGLAPGILITNLFAHQFESAIRNPGIGTFLLLLALIVISIIGGVWLKRRFQQAKA